MKVRFFYANAVYATWSKLFVLTEDNVFYSEYKNHNKISKIELKFDFSLFNETDYQFRGYQSIIEISQEKALSTTLRAQSNWILSYLNMKCREEVQSQNITFEKAIEILEFNKIPYCYNKEAYDFKKIKYIIVGDNPGKNEYLTNRFFVGASGQVLRKHFIDNNLVEDFDQECFISNKTLIHTEKTNHLREVRLQIGEVPFNRIQQECANEIANLTNEYNIPILIVGKSHLKPNLLFEAFWKELNKKINNQDLIYVFGHPSHSHFVNEWELCKNQFINLTPIELLFQIGRMNTNKIKQLFNN
jgi:hypothetical protein